jgi:prephenate dehydrogenase
MIITIVGIGLIGGSLALDLKKRGFAEKIIGVDNNVQHRNIALLCGLVDETDTLENAVGKSDLILLCTPVNTNCSILPSILDMIGNSSKVVTDMGSTKAGISEVCRDHPFRGRYVAAHPMAGTEFSGPLAAHSRLFDYKTAIICDPEKSDRDALAVLENLFAILNMKVVFMDSHEHDVHVAYVSHISHITSFSLALCVLEKEHETENILTLAGGGFESTVRLAKSNGETWAPIFSENSNYILEVIDTYIEKMNIFRNLLVKKDISGLKRLMDEANKIQKILN